MKSVQYCDWSRLNISYIRLLLLLLLNTFIVFFVSKVLINLMKHTHTEQRYLPPLDLTSTGLYSEIFDKFKHLTRKKIKQ